MRFSDAGLRYGRREDRNEEMKKKILISDGMNIISLILWAIFDKITNVNILHACWFTIRHNDR